ncbi:hypothetical protein [Pseudomonas paralcaligenes]|uniref:hypothetical protein n=1 Tax=Pseudomonas paralcaligenes TaxID=2772558 RepID=UPI001C7F8975|nr:hypothetical protein [Pseudomonas paralcaligenes]
MRVYVRDAHANKQIKTIASFVEDGLSDSEIIERLVCVGYKNLAREDGVWSAGDVRAIRDKFRLDISDGFDVVRNKNEINIKNESGTSSFYGVLWVIARNFCGHWWASGCCGRFCC